MITFVAPCYNRPALLERMLASLKDQTSDDFELLLMDDYSSDPNVDKVVQEFFPGLKGAYFRSSPVSKEERAKSCRGARIVNILTPLASGNVIGYLSDDKECHPDLVKTVNEWFKQNPTKGAGYTGVGYRFLDWKTGNPTVPPKVDGAREWIGRLSSDGAIRVKVPSPSGDSEEYGKPLKRVFGVLDSVQFFNRKELSVVWNENHLLGADAEAMQCIANRIGLVHPIGDVDKPMVCSNLNNSSLTVTQDMKLTIDRLT